MKKPPPLPEVKRRLREAIRAGKVAYAHPKATECFPIGKDLAQQGNDFHYVEATVLAPFSDPEVEAKWHHQGGIHFQWGIKGFGFGEASIVLRKGKWEASVEGLAKEFLQNLLTAWTKKMKLR